MVQINSLEKYISIIKGFYASEGCAGVQKIFYRGQSNCNYKLIPSLTHILEGYTDDCENYIAFEKQIIERTKSEYPDMFGDNNSIDELALLQHYALHCGRGSGSHPCKQQHISPVVDAPAIPLQVALFYR